MLSIATMRIIAASASSSSTTTSTAGGSNGNLTSEPLQTGMTQTGAEVMELDQVAGHVSHSDGSDPMATATLGTTSSPQGSTGRGRRS